MYPIFDFVAPPTPSLDEIDLAFVRGAEAKKGDGDISTFGH